MFKHFAIGVSTLLATCALIGCGGKGNDGLPDTGTVGTRILGTWTAASITVGEETAECPGGSVGSISCPAGDVIFRTDGTARYDGQSITYNFFDGVLRLDTRPPQAFDVAFTNKAQNAEITSKTYPGLKLTLQKVAN
jgi:hypothetical protein